MLTLPSLLLTLACGSEPAVPAKPAVPAAPAKPAAPAASSPTTPPPTPVAPATPAGKDGYTVLKSATGDLTGDGTSDVVAILTKGADMDMTATLQITLADPVAPNKVIEAPKAVCAMCGSVKGEPVPFDVDINANSRVLSLSMTGGSREMYEIITKWRFQNNQFELIGVTDSLVDTLAEDVGAVSSVTRDANISTRKMNEETETVTAMGVDGPTTAKKQVSCDIPAGPAVVLNTHDSSSYHAPNCTK